MTYMLPHTALRLCGSSYNYGVKEMPEPDFDPIRLCDERVIPDPAVAVPYRGGAAAWPT
jgi:hypothetical protein